MHRNHLKEAAWFPSYMTGVMQRALSLLLAILPSRQAPTSGSPSKLYSPCSSRATARPDPNTARPSPPPPSPPSSTATLGPPAPSSAWGSSGRGAGSTSGGFPSRS